MRKACSGGTIGRQKEIQRGYSLSPAADSSSPGNEYSIGKVSSHLTSSTPISTTSMNSPSSASPPPWLFLSFSVTWITNRLRHYVLLKKSNLQAEDGLTGPPSAHTGRVGDYVLQPGGLHLVTTLLKHLEQNKCYSNLCFTASHFFFGDLGQAQVFVDNSSTELECETFLACLSQPVKMFLQKKMEIRTGRIPQPLTMFLQNKMENLKR